MAVGSAPVIQARDRLLADVAALGEAHRALVQARLLRDHAAVEIHSVARAPVLDAHDLGGVLGYGRGAPFAQRLYELVRVGGVADEVDAGVGPRCDRRDARDLHGRVGVFHLPQILGLGDAGGVGADQRQQPALDRALVQLQVIADPEPADHVEQGLQRDALGVEQQLLADVEHAQIAEHVALVGEERGIAAGPGRERLDVVGHLAGEEPLRLGAAERELAPLGAVDQTAALRERRVLSAEPVRVDVGCRHCFEDSPRLNPQLACAARGLARLRCEAGRRTQTGYSSRRWA